MYTRLLLVSIVDLGVSHMPPTQPPLQVQQQPKLQDSQPKKVIQPKKITTDG